MLNYGLQSGWASPMKKVLQADTSPTGRPLTDSEITWVASAMPLAGVLGTFMYAYIADAYGRKIGVLTMLILQALCWVIKITLTPTIALIAARICAGLPSGGCFNLVPMYINEISQENVRGAMVAVGMSIINVGLLTMYAMGGYLDYFLISWIGLGITLMASILFMLLVPESPGYLVKIEKYEDAANTVANLRGLDSDDIVVQDALEYMKTQEKTLGAMESITLISILKNKAWLRGFLLCMFNVSIVDFNGYLTIGTYAWTILTNAGVTVNAELQTLSIPIISLFGALISMCCVEKFGRKRILVIAFLLSALTMACLGTILLLQHVADVTVPSWTPMVAIVVAVWTYSGGVLPMVYIVVSEMFTFKVRAKLLGPIAAYGWFVGFIQIYCYLPISNSFGMHTTFFVYAGVNLAGGLVALLFLPETMGKTVEEIERALLGKKL